MRAHRVLVALFVLGGSLPLCADGEEPLKSPPCQQTDGSGEVCNRSLLQTWPQRCDSPFQAHHECTLEHSGAGSSTSGARTFVVLLNSFEKLTWATVGLGRLLAMTNSSHGVSFVEPCVADSGCSHSLTLGEQAESYSGGKHVCNALDLFNVVAIRASARMHQAGICRTWAAFAREIGGFGRHDWLQLDTYFDTQRLKSTLRADALVTVEEYVRSMRCSRRAAILNALPPAQQSPGSDSSALRTEERGLNLDPSRCLDALIVFVWWEEERKDLVFRPPLGLADCHKRLLAKGHIRRFVAHGNVIGGLEWFEVDRMKEGTDNRTIDAPGMVFRRVICADPYSLDSARVHAEHGHPLSPPDAHATAAETAESAARASRTNLLDVEGRDLSLSRGQWLAALSRHLRELDRREGVGYSRGAGSADEASRSSVLAMALASYRRTALAHVQAGEERWGRWAEDAWMAQQVAVPPGILRSVEVLLRRFIPGPFLAVHFRAGRILNRGTVDGGEGSKASNRFRRIAYEGADLAAVLAYPLECAQAILVRARAIMKQEGLGAVFLATDLVEGMMPELETSNPATTLPLMRPEHRQQLVETAEQAWQLLRDGLDPVVLSSHLLHADLGPEDSDPAVNVVQALVDRGLAAIIDRELLSRGQVFLYAGQYAGRCEATGYSEGVRERRKQLGRTESSSIFVSECCMVDSPAVYLPKDS